MNYLPHMRHFFFLCNSIVINLHPMKMTSIHSQTSVEVKSAKSGKKEAEG